MPKQNKYLKGKPDKFTFFGRGGEVRIEPMFNKDRQISGYTPLLYDDAGRLHSFGFSGEYSHNYLPYPTPEAAQEAWDKARLTYSYKNCPCMLQRTRFVTIDDAGDSLEAS